MSEEELHAQAARYTCFSSNELRVPANIRLIQQPASSPEVNPVEHLWEELREKYLHKRVFASRDLLIEELCRGLNELADDKATCDFHDEFASSQWSYLEGGLV